MEIIATLYGAVLNVKPGRPDGIDRDRFIISKRHFYLVSEESGNVSGKTKKLDGGYAI